MLVIGLTGGIGTGKSEVSRILGELGAAVIDADKVGHQAYRPHSEAWDEVVATFGADILQPTGEIDRKRLGALVFGDAEAMARLNAIMHPRMQRMIEDEIDRICGDGSHAVVVEAALLFEAGWERLVDEVWVTSSPEDLVLERLRRRNGLPDEEIRRRIGSQLPSEERSRRADVVIVNSGTSQELRDEVEGLWSGRVIRKVG